MSHSTVGLSVSRLMHIRLMKWSWDKFGFQQPRDEVLSVLDAIFARHFPEFASGTWKIITAIRDSNSLKVAVSGTTSKDEDSIDRRALKRIREELGVNFIQIIPRSDAPEVFIAAALAPAQIDQVVLYELIGRAVVYVHEDQLAVAIGPRANNVRAASKLCEWDIEVVTAVQFEEQRARARKFFCRIEGIDEALADKLVDLGFLTFDDLSIIEPEILHELGFTEEADGIIEQAEFNAETEEREN